MKALFLFSFLISLNAFAGPPLPNETQIKINSEKPIIYGTGVAGITLQTTLTEAETLLTAPQSFDATTGDALYNEGLYIRWNMEEPRTPQFILVLSSYRGPIESTLSSEIISVGHDFSNRYTADSMESAEELAKFLFKTFENSTDDCLALSTCEVSWGASDQKNFIITLPKMTFLLSKDKFVLFRLMLVP